MTHRGISIGEAARQTGVKVPTIRFYEQIGLLPAPPRSEGNRRQFDEKDLSRLAFIRHARELGFEIGDIRELLQLSEEPQSSCHEADSIAQRHVAEIKERIARLQALSEELQRMVDECGHGKVCECRVIQILADHSKCRSDVH
ncbi:helix-turn-helix domain-containing protein [Chelativorans sp. SCAU2101]|uniref:Helix-turn-helix domain-containing protein n=1 Tax=Chelativorans petroleitrophicus TaxID=2975484 RepID=A0A9X2X8S0_9HYPH|nr:helix-turn-helix domain-containing protein [Chelativorans petroleitrophicus]MCT8989777.1 helix-turn-helix domain-containing protein [Chelativorans petroleitrophicus]